MLLDRLKPYAEVYGLPGVVFEQDGQYFNAAGISAVPKAEVEDDEPIDDDSPLPYICVHEQSTAPIDSPPENTDTLETMHWKHLKALVESYGGEWNSKTEAIEFLRGKK